MQRFQNQDQSQNFKPVSEVALKKFGISRDEGLRIVDTVNELEKYPPNIVIGEAIKNVQYIQNNYKRQQLRKKQKYVMPLSMYQQLHFDTKSDTKILKPSGAKFNNLYKKYNGQNLTNKTILFWRTGGIGDLLFIKPNLDYLKEKYPSCKIIFGCGPQYQSMLETWESIDEIIDLPFTVNKLTEAHYHAIFEGVIERTKEANTKNAYKLFTSWLKLNLPEGKLRPKQDPKQERVDKCRSDLNENGLEPENFLLTQITSSSPIRTVSTKSISNVINELTSRGHKVIITDNPSKKQVIDQVIKQHINDKDMVYNFAYYSDSIDYTIALASLAKGCLSVDSALVHISESVSRPIFGIYGPFPGNIRMETYNDADWIDCGKGELDCVPCNTHGRKPCHHGYAKCYDKTLQDNDRLKDIGNRIENLVKE